MGVSQPAKAFLRALSGEKTEKPPVWLMRQAGRYLPEYRETRKAARNFLDFCYTPDLAVEVTLQPLRRYSFDAAIMFSDILVIPDALGQDVSFKEGVGPVLDPIKDISDVDRMDPERVLEHLSPVFEILSRLRREIPATTSLIGFAGAPWTIAYYMIEGGSGKDGSQLRRFAHAEPVAFDRLMTKIVDATVAYLCKQVDAGAEALQLFDSWSGIAGETLFRRWIIEPTTDIVDRVKARHPGIPIIGFPRNAGVLYADYVTETGVDGVSLDTQVPLDWAVKTLRPHAVLQGNLDNQVLVAGGDAMDGEVRRILDKFSGGPFIFNLGHGIVPNTPPENVARVIDLIRS